ncbi:MAG: MFS family permease [Limisphaerales bacterium]|jgi:MFS family permease
MVFRSILSRMDTLFRPRGKVFYGWYIVLAATGIQWLAAMTWMHSYGAYTTLLQADFGWSMSILSLAFALTRLESGLLGPLQGWLVDRYGPRLILTIGTVIFSIGFFMFSIVDSIPTFFVAFILIALGSSLGGWATLMVSIVTWFDKHRAKAIAWSQIGFSLGGLSVWLIAIGLESYGWRVMAMVSGIGILLIAVPLSQLVRHRPEEIGEVPDGIRYDESNEHHAPPAMVSFTWQQASRAPSFWLISFGHAFSLLTVSSLLMHLVPHLIKGLEFSLVDATIVFGMMTGVQLIGLFLGGYLGDRFDKRLLCVYCMVAHFIGLLSITYATNYSMIALFLLAHGLGWGIRGPLMVALRADYFGPKSFGTIMGISSLIVMIGMTVGPIFCGYMFDIYGNYERAFTIMASVSLLGSICFYFARPPKLPV